MSPEYEVKLADRDYTVEVRKLDEGGLLVVKLGSQSFTLKPTLNEDGAWTVSDTAGDYSVRILKKAGSKVSVEVNGEACDIEWVRIRKQETGSPKTTSASGSRVSGGVYPPMPGKITEVLVKPGDTVKSGQTVCILEAMKMFNELKSPSAGVVKEINVEPGSSVTPNSLLILVE
ncbi:MAG: biotin/lipoyl-binding protein [Candidatus Thorarchaeota archaeon]|nr:biotin/lipoyl-binding protein [Candidatus Thorarchaeota archaeon]